MQGKACALHICKGGSCSASRGLSWRPASSEERDSGSSRESYSLEQNIHRISGLAEARRGAEPGLPPRALDRKERLGASGLTRTLCPATPRRRRSGARAGAALYVWI